jgi:hypothetical protein
MILQEVTTARSEQVAEIKAAQRQAALGLHKRCHISSALTSAGLRIGMLVVAVDGYWPARERAAAVSAPSRTIAARR